jgi:hypothetical protein
MLRAFKTVLVASTLAAALTACAKPADTGTASDAGSPTTRSISQAPPAPSASPTTSTPAPSARSGGSVTPPSPPATGTGIAGVTTIDGGCPVARAEPPCPDRPITAHLSILNASGKVVTTVDSDNNGHFTAALPPGSYVVRPETLAGASPHAPEGAAVTVKAGQYTVVTLRFDSGIR